MPHDTTSRATRSHAHVRARVWNAPARIHGALAAMLVLATAAAMALAAPLDAHADQGTPVGTVVAWGGTAVPSGWLRTNGGEVSRTTYPDLFAAIGTTYGAGSTADLFRLPDMDRRIPLGQNASGVGTGGQVGDVGGTTKHTHAFGSHAHTIQAGGDHTHTWSSHSHSSPGHGHNGFWNISMTAAGAHRHSAAGNRFFVVWDGASPSFNIATGGIQIDRLSTTTTDGNHNHDAPNRSFGNAADPIGDSALTTTATAPTAQAVGSHTHGGTTGMSVATTTGGSDPAYTAVDYLIKALPSAGSPCGAIWGTARTTADAGAYLARGTQLQRATEPALDACLGTTFGAPDALSFRLPDLQGRFPLGVAAAAGTDYDLAEQGGAMQHAHDADHGHGVTAQAGHAISLPSHTHANPGHRHIGDMTLPTDGAHSHQPNSGAAFVGDWTAGESRNSQGSRNYDLPHTTEWAGGHDHTVSGNVGSTAVGAPNGNSAITTTSSTATTAATSPSHDHGGTTSTDVDTGTADPAYTAINFQVQSTPGATSVGTVALWPGTGAPPAGWRIANGDLLNVADYGALHTAIGNAYGGDGVTNFRLPDLTGRFALGKAAAGVGTTLGEQGGSLDHSHSTSHAHSVAAAADHDHGSVTHGHSVPGHFHSFSVDTNNGGNHNHGLPGSNWFWGEHLPDGEMPVQDAGTGGSKGASHVQNTDERWASHRHSGTPSGSVGIVSTRNGDSAQAVVDAASASSAAGGHAHTISAATAGTSSNNPRFMVMRYMIRVVPATIVDNQAGDATWRNSNSGSYDVDFLEPAGLSSLQTNVWSAAGQTGTERQAWTQFAAPGGSSYTSNWSLAASTWTAMAEGTNHVSVRMLTASGQSTTAVDVFTVRKDTLAASPTSVTDGSGAGVDWSTNASSVPIAWTGSTGEAGSSGVARYDYCISTSSGCTGTVARTWTSAGTSTSITATGLTLADGTAYVVSVRMVDLAGNVSSSAASDGFRVDATPPLAPTLVTPPAGSAHPTWPALTVTYEDGSQGSPGQMSYELCSTSDCSAVVTTQASATGLSSGTDASWTPAVADGTYWWRVQATDAAGQTGPWSGPFRVQVGSSTMSLGVSDAPLGLVTPGTPSVITTSVQASSNAVNGYQLQVADTSDTLGITGAANVPDWTGTVATPTVWSSGTVGYFGMSVLDAPGGRHSRWGDTGGPYPSTDFARNRFAGLTTTSQTIHARSGFDPASETIDVAFRFAAGASANAGSYATTVSVTLIANP